MPERRDQDRLQDILDETDFLARALTSVDFDRFAADETLQRAVLHALQTIGEAAGALSDATKRSMPDVPWAQVRGLCNRIVHGYFGIDLDAVWLTATTDAARIAHAVREHLTAAN